MRFIAAFAVFVFHYFRDIKSFYPGIEENLLFKTALIFADKGGLGVNFFFVLSGFLITYLILHEKHHTGSFNLYHFLVRRTLRIWPLYFIIVLIGFVFFPIMFNSYSTLHDPVMYLFFLANFDEIKNGLHDSVNFLTAPWSVAVEEQFYLVWSFMLLIFMRIKGFKTSYLIILLYIVSFWFRWEFRDDERVLYYHTLSVCQDILMGALFGIALYKNKPWIQQIANMHRWKIVLIYILGLGVCVFKNKIFTGDIVVFERFFLSLFFGFVIAEQTLGKHSFFKVGKISWMTNLGKMSYGFYMYHLVVMYVLCRLVAAFLPTGYYLIPLYFAASLLVTLLISYLSFRWIETPFLKLKSRFG
ncbi:MAG: acyltransferase [Crocinitomicaceae bacterium]|nr:acyltransferase [Crocinitomicaceae bacterium]MBK8924419.1 acyltransferase [Crocinitomicaceae bacterium]